MEAKTYGLRNRPRGPIPKCGHVALVLDCCYVDICVIFSSSGSLRMRLISQFSRASGARFSETDDSPRRGVRYLLACHEFFIPAIETTSSVAVDGAVLIMRQLVRPRQVVG